MILSMRPLPDKDSPESAGVSRKDRVAGIIITALGAVLLARGAYDYFAGTDGVQEVFMLGVSVLIVFLGLYKSFSASVPPRR